MMLCYLPSLLFLHLSSCCIKLQSANSEVHNNPINEISNNCRLKQLTFKQPKYLIKNTKWIWWSFKLKSDEILSNILDVFKYVNMSISIEQRMDTQSLMHCSRVVPAKHIMSGIRYNSSSIKTFAKSDVLLSFFVLFFLRKITI